MVDLADVGCPSSLMYACKHEKHYHMLIIAWKRGVRPIICFNSYSVQSKMIKLKTRKQSVAGYRDDPITPQDGPSATQSGA